MRNENRVCPLFDMFQWPFSFFAFLLSLNAAKNTNRGGGEFLKALLLKSCKSHGLRALSLSTHSCRTI